MEKTTGGWINGCIGVMIFAGSLPATRVAVADFSPVFLTCARASIAAALGLALLLGFRQPRPRRAELPALAMTALGVVAGFPLLTALALQHVTSAHSIVFVGLLPLCTAVFAVLRAGERPRPPFWVFSLAGACSASAVSRGNPATTPSAVIAKAGSSARRGRGCRNPSRSASPSAAAMLARAQVRNTGEKSATA
ncbi:DMT family transporter, partial [Xanthomonas sp. LMG 12461]|uniref:DMT family transporter n=1 Tax=Xanthomonas sp. LMG 12461 TaxID=2014543 RepID=UPI001D05B703